MHVRLSLWLALTFPLVLAAPAQPARSDDAKQKPAADTVSLSQQGRKAIERGLTFLQNDAVKWRKDRSCATCHHGTMTVWALAEAKRQGYTVAAETWAETLKWTKERLKNIDAPRDMRDGWKMVNSPAVYLATMAQAVPGQDALSADELKQIAGHLLRHQEADGSWAWSLAPAKNRPPPFFESDEVVTLLAYMALGPHVPTDPQEKSPIRDGREKAAAWLAKTKPNDTTQAAAIRLLAKARAGEPAPAHHKEQALRKEEQVLQKEIDEFLKRQNKDGGWSQLSNRSSDAYATGQSIYILSLVGVKSDRPEVQRARAFLLSTQKDDGSWPMKSRGHAGEDRASNPVPITYFGSAWATLGLMRTASK